MNNNFAKQMGTPNPLDGVNLGKRVTPKLIDFDGDGDLDLIVGNEAGTIDYLKNVGDKNTPQFVKQEGAANPFDGIVITEERSNPSFYVSTTSKSGIPTAIFIGNKEGSISLYNYDGTKISFAQMVPGFPSNQDLNGRSAPTWADLNGDGLLDLVVGFGNGTMELWTNTPNESGLLNIKPQLGNDNPFNGIDVGFNATPTFQDVDGDGDLDGIVGNFYEGINYLENIGTAKAPKFVQREGKDNPFNNVQGIEGNVPTLGDIDGDGDLDLLVGDVDGNINYFVNSPSVSIAPGNVTPTEAGETPGFFEVKLSEPAPASGLTIQYQVENREISATEGVDYQPLSGTVKIAPGATTGKIEIVPIDDKDKDSIETVTVSLTGVSERYVVDEGNNTAHLAIADNEGNPIIAKILNEPNFKDQWYLNNTEDNIGTPGVDINVLKVWEDYSGKGVEVGVVDERIDVNHPDLDANFNPRSYSGNLTSDAHGTAVAGIIAAEAGNGLGGVGVAFDATLNAYNIVDYKVAQTTPALVDQVNVDISSNSWRSTVSFGTNFLRYPGIQQRDAIENAIAKGRNGLGTIFVFLGGNEREEGGNVNYENRINSRRTIAVAALDTDGTFAGFSSPGAALLVSAPGTAIFTTDHVGQGGYEPGDYDHYFSGTSAATPVVSGVVALMLEANPELGYRDVQEILAYSAKWNDTKNKSWGFNGAKNWNGGGLHYSSDYGFGQVDALAAVRLAETWQTQHTVANEQQITVSSNKTRAIPNNNPAGLTDTLKVKQELNIDHVQVGLTINHQKYGDLIVTLTSPTGVVSELVNQPSRAMSVSEVKSGDYVFGQVDNQDFTYFFDTTFDWGETGKGDWTLKVVDAADGNTGVVKNWQLDLFGDKITKKDTYIYTNDFANDALNDLANRQILKDTNGGKDTINAAAVSSDLVLDLRSGNTSTIAGRKVTIDAGTEIEKAFGGDGNDRIIGNEKNNVLDGGRGNDTFVFNTEQLGLNIIENANNQDTLDISAYKTADFTTKKVGKDFIFDFAQKGSITIQDYYKLAKGDRINIIDADTNPAPEPTPAPQPTPTPQPSAIRINAGGGDFTDSNGDVWMADKYFQGGRTYSTTAGIDKTQDDKLFQSERYAKELSYAIPVENGNYTVNLDFAEIYWDLDNKRVFDVKAENQLVLDNFDIHQGAGGKSIATEQSFNVNVQDGVLNLDFSTDVDHAKISGIEVIAS